MKPDGNGTRDAAVPHAIDDWQIGVNLVAALLLQLRQCGLEVRVHRDDPTGFYLVPERLITVGKALTT